MTSYFKKPNQRKPEARGEKLAE